MITKLLAQNAVHKFRIVFRTETFSLTPQISGGWLVNISH
jgi:hypothetical protein